MIRIIGKLYYYDLLLHAFPERLKTTTSRASGGIPFEIPDFISEKICERMAAV